MALDQSIGVQILCPQLKGSHNDDEGLFISNPPTLGVAVKTGRITPNACFPAPVAAQNRGEFCTFDSCNMPEFGKAKPVTKAK
jgi:hypothetical protein